MIAVYVATTGRLVSLASSMKEVADPLPPDLVAKDVGVVDVSLQIWDEATTEFILRVAPPLTTAQTAADALADKPELEWTDKDVAIALRLVMLSLRRKFD
jgi:hypothetical protein